MVKYNPWVYDTKLVKMFKQFLLDVDGIVSDNEVSNIMNTTEKNLKPNNFPDFLSRYIAQSSNNRFNLTGLISMFDYSHVKEYVEYINLSCNFRSEEEVISFIRTLFTHLIEEVRTEEMSLSNYNLITKDIILSFLRGIVTVSNSLLVTHNLAIKNIAVKYRINDVPILFNNGHNYDNFILPNYHEIGEIYNSDISSIIDFGHMNILDNSNMLEFIDKYTLYDFKIFSAMIKNCVYSPRYVFRYLLYLKFNLAQYNLMLGKYS